MTTSFTILLRKGGITLMLEGRPMTLATYKIKLFVTIVNKAFQPLTGVTKSSIFDTTEVLDPLLVFIGLLFIWFKFFASDLNDLSVKTGYTDLFAFDKTGNTRILS